MRILTILLPLLFAGLIFSSCRGKAGGARFPETFEQGSKRVYAAGDVALGSGMWHLDNALIGKNADDRKEGSGALRLAQGGSATMLFDVTLSSDTVVISLAPFGNDGDPVLSLWVSIDGGANWQRIGTAGSREGASLQTIALPLPHFTKPVRFSIRNEGEGRVDADNFTPGLASSSVRTVANDRSIIGNGNHRAATVTNDHSDNLALGNPSGATTSADNTNNYLLERLQYTLSYNNSRGIANWVSWHLQASDQGNADRCNCFSPDSSLPEGFYRAVTSAYSGSGFDRGHLCPSGDRSASASDNAATFLLSNIAPQAPFLNEQTWARLETYCRQLTGHGMELYIIAGAYGSGGSGKNGGNTKTIANGRIAVPARFWKIIVVLPVGDNDVRRISADTRIIAVDMPNAQSVNAHPWNYYRTTISKIEAATGYRFLSNVPESVRTVLRNKIDGGLRSSEN